MEIQSFLSETNNLKFQSTEVYHKNMTDLQSDSGVKHITAVS